MVPSYIRKRLYELSLLESGWYGPGEGEPIRLESVHNAMDRFEDYQGVRVYLYPTIEGLISAEWDEGGPEDEIL